MSRLLNSRHQNRHGQIEYFMKVGNSRKTVENTVVDERRLLVTLANFIHRKLHASAINLNESRNDRGEM